VIARRMSKSEAEISHWAEYDYVIVNENIDLAMAELTAVVIAERLKRKRQLWLGPFRAGSFKELLIFESSRLIFLPVFVLV